MRATAIGALGVFLLSQAGVFAAADARLIGAIRAKDATAVRALLKQRVDVNAPQGDGTTALHWAAHVNDLTIADLLIRAGARGAVANENGFTPLHVACINRGGAMVERLLAARADANAASINGETVLMTCARAGDARGVKALLLKGARVNVKETPHDQTALMWAAAQRHPEVTGLLIEAGAEINARSRTFPQTVVGEQTQRFGREELNYTVLRGGSTPLLFAARSGDAASARLLLGAGASANDALPEGMSALVVAAHSGHTEVATLLLENGANPDSADAGYTALHAAVLRSDLTLVKALLASGANPNLRTTKGTPIRRDTTDFNLPATLIGSTPYLLAARFLEPEIMTALTAAGADATLTMRDGATALMVATGAGSSPNATRRGIAVIDGGKVEPESEVLGAVAAAIELGADLNATNQAGDTALHVAAGRGLNAVVQLLADRGAQLNVKNKRGLTPLAALMPANAGVRRRGAAITAAAIADDDDDADRPSPRAPNFPETVELLKKLGATE
ncbi:MAG: ankyrin repeat domain-containing protein [Acidobacteria bacterium]|nr:MAG: ankyrin repeat domain-containing protein [Acidobacteriota bacterium]